MLWLIKDITVWKFWYFLFCLFPLLFDIPTILLLLARNRIQKLEKLIKTLLLNLILASVLAVMLFAVFEYYSFVSVGALMLCFFLSVVSLKIIHLKIENEVPFLKFMKREILSFLKYKATWLVVVLVL